LISGIGTSSLEIYERELEDLKPKTKQSKQAQKFIENLEDNIEEVSGFVPFFSYEMMDI